MRATSEAILDIVETITQVLDTSALAALAIYAIWQVQVVWRQYNSEISGLRRETAEALKNNTEAMTRLCERLNDK